MSTSFSIAFTDDGRLQVSVSGKLSGHAARKGLDLLRTAVDSGRRKICLDLSETVSIDSLGISIFDWIRSQNGSLNVNIQPPLRGVSDDEIEVISRAANSACTTGQAFNHLIGG
ncbi:MAG: hypothetical protein E3J72_07575 [Planctomycetota bacterium]|nr:MAG: hypothetical protein E3J72_07575 [Planctomycetota bacterium]